MSIVSRRCMTGMRGCQPEPYDAQSRQCGQHSLQRSTIVLVAHFTDPIKNLMASKSPVKDLIGNDPFHKPQLKISAIKIVG